MVEEHKESVRNILKDLRKKLPWDFRYDVSYKISKRIIQSNLYRNAKHIGMYRSANGEVDLNHLWTTACSHGKYCYFPVINSKNSLEFYPANPNTEFVFNKFNIEEPAVTADSEPLSVIKLDLILMPLISFDNAGNRLGMGAGFYDRTLERLITQQHKSTTLLGVAYEFQRRNSLAHYPWDVLLDCVITEHDFYRK